MHAHRPRSLQGGIEHIVGAYQGTGMRHRGLGAGTMTTDFERHYRFHARGTAQATHETARITNAFYI